METNLNNLANAQIDKVYAWGLGKSGELGNGTLSDSQPIPIAVFPSKSEKQPLKIIAVSTGGMSSFCLTDNGRVYAWGSGKNYRTGHSSEEPKLKPTMVDALKSTKVTSVSGGDWHAAAITNDGKVYTWGYGRKGGGLGHGNDTPDNNLPKMVEGLASKRITKVSCGHNLTGFIADDFTVYLAGTIHGNGTNGLPYRIPNLEGLKVTDISCGFKMALILADTNVYVWGSSNYGALGLGSNVKEAKIPIKLKELEGKQAIQVSCSNSEHHTRSGVVTSSGELYTWGSGYKGALGHNDTDDSWSPRLVTTLQNYFVHYLSNGRIHAAVIASPKDAASPTRQLLTFGCGSDGRLGHIEQVGHRYIYKEEAPRVVEAFSGQQVISVSLAQYHTVALVGDSFV